MKSVEIIPSTLNGEIKVPPSKSLSHRAIIASALCDGESTIKNILLSQDILRTCYGVKAFGAKIDYDQEGSGDTQTLNIRGNSKIKVVNKTIDCGESASTLRFLIPLATLTKESISFKGSGRLSQRPLDPYYEIFRMQNLPYESKEGKLPLSIHGILNAGTFRIPGDISSQFITGLLFVLPLLKEDSFIKITSPLESKAYVDLTIDLLNKFSIKVDNKNYKEFYIAGNQRYKPRHDAIEGDFSQAAFWMVAGILGGEITISQLNIHTLQGDQMILEIIKKMAGHIIIEEEIITSLFSKTRGITIDVRHCPDLVPIIAVLAALSKGITKITNAGRLRIKESDRLEAITKGLNKLGAKVIELEDQLIIEGVETLRGGVVDSYHDHRIAMALAIASIKCTQPMIINNSDVVKKSYPNFWQDFSRLGGRINERNMG